MVDSKQRLDEALATVTDETGWLTTGEMARRSGTTLRTVRFYEAEGLITSMARADGTHRRFPMEEFRKLQIISALRDSGLSLQRIKDLMAIKEHCSTPRAAASEVTTALCAQLEDIDRRIETLQTLRDDLLSTVGLLRTCQDCTEPGFPERCQKCEVVDQPGCARSADLLWKN